MEYAVDELKLREDDARMTIGLDVLDLERTLNFLQPGNVEAATARVLEIKASRLGIAQSITQELLQKRYEENRALLGGTGKNSVG